MQKQLFLRLLCVLLPGVAMAQETKVQITDKISILFPEKPAVRDIQGVATLHTLRLADSTANFNVVVSNLEKSNGFTAEVLAAAQLEPEFWQQAEAGFVGQLGAGATVAKKELKDLHGRQTLVMTVNSMAGGKPAELTVYIFLEGVYSVNVVHSKRNDQASLALRDKFFASLTMAE